MALRTSDRHAGLISISVAGLIVFAAWAGPLNPPAGPVASTHKTLTDVEPRTAINATNTPGDADSLFRITAPGSYYLTGNITGVVGKHGIKIALGPSGGHVNIDMMGFTLNWLGTGAQTTVNAINMLDTLGNCSWQIRSGSIVGWPGYAISAGGAGRLADLRVMSPADGCTNLTAGSNRTTTIENCTFRSTNGPALVTDSTVACEIRNSIIEGDGCNTTNITFHGGPVMMSGVTTRVRNSTFSGPIIDIGPASSLARDTCQTTLTSCTAPSALHISPGPGAAVVLNDHWDWGPGGITGALIDIARDGTQLRNISVRASAGSSAPAGLRVAASNVGIDEGLWNFSGASVPVALDVIGANNSISHVRVGEDGNGIRLTGASNTVTDCRFSGTGAGSFTGVLIPAGSTNNLITKNEFVNLGAGTAVSNLGGSTNGVAPIVTPGNLNAATNPFSNIQH